MSRFYIPLDETVKTKVLPDFSSITSIGESGLQEVFQNCSGLTGSISFPKLPSIGPAGFDSAFSGCTGITGISFPKLTAIDASGLVRAFYKCTGLTGSISFPNLTTIGISGLNNAFSGCTGITEVHFKSSLSGNSQCTSSNMGCTNATVFFDL